ncbi:hypothetical protein BO70DRAFT_341179 [Aspergillus heteromorphus CBS 117.55]|uniref:Peptidase M20 domain-containing protein 2 n=1 Tax=Aspergillus heteromorphus CBS 117.55 TaxID=1448321 RepID=A0A317VNB4_9EURO|nr:uncharacterized protein BO70DRAFT_341179 [Aspergillus heteromorphus CBS 117.55]PWY74342.1 hypothetical protein BO70DRAFT_341179 [Aspergillus heteromorphus CBS 117.55]
MSLLDTVRTHIASAIDTDAEPLRQLNRDIHSHPETAYEEVYAHDTLATFLESRNWAVTRHAYGLATSFEAETSTSTTGPIVVFCAEYDALPGIGHGCGHNLIATSSIAAFLSLSSAIRQLDIPARVRILGTPAEEGGGGKAKLIDAGAFSDPDIVAAIMAHPISLHGLPDGYQGISGFRTVASHKLRVEYRGKGAHAGGDPWNGKNALDAAVGAYNNISLLRQQIQPDERIHGVIESGGSVPNVIPDYTRMNWYIRSPTTARADDLLVRAKACFEAAGIATGCEVNYIMAPTYKDLVLNDTFCAVYKQEMAVLERTILLKQETTATVSTDMGNVSHVVPSFHGVFGIPTPPNIPGHHPEFAKAAALDEAHEEAILTARGMAMLGWSVLVQAR